jgi:hypothetical protein
MLLSDSGERLNMALTPVMAAMHALWLFRTLYNISARQLTS